jgi:hypothetical protein
MGMGSYDESEQQEQEIDLGEEAEVYTLGSSRKSGDVSSETPDNPDVLMDVYKNSSDS